MVMSQTVLVALGIDWDGRRQIVAVEMANRESRSSWKHFLLDLRRRGLNGVEFVVADDHAGLRTAIREVLPEAAFQRCYVGSLKKWPTAGPIGLRTRLGFKRQEWRSDAIHGSTPPPANDPDPKKRNQSGGQQRFRIPVRGHAPNLPNLWPVALQIAVTAAWDLPFQGFGHLLATLNHLTMLAAAST